MPKKSEREPWASLQKNIEHAAHSARACAGLDMSQVPAEAVRELVECVDHHRQAQELFYSYESDWWDGEWPSDDVRRAAWASVKEVWKQARKDRDAALAPFVKE